MNKECPFLDYLLTEYLYLKFRAARRRALIDKKSAPCNQAKCTFVYTTWGQDALKQYIAV